MKIEKNIPMPKRIYKGGESKWAMFEVGDSIFEKDSDHQGNLAIGARAYGLRHNKKFTARKMDGGIRIWRVK